MRLVEKTARVTRRGFLKGTGLASIGVTVIPATALMTAPAEVYAQAFKTLGPEAGKDLLRLARDIFPHDRLADKYYLHAIEPYDAAAAKDAKTRKLFVDGLKLLNTTAQKMHKQPYARITDEAKRVQVLVAIEDSPFFQKVKGDLVTGLYDNKAVYPFFGYEGSSWEKGGYINRGFNDIDWVQGD
ncbi:Twin-arginine translocation pathway signal [Noviherbaspirillum denitrificans]|uniref:Twin-arginine translocation pathway signal n=2 Tax=Noviherbaspirillum denitrificans TaxID=1968433 RepID=A0A254TJP1_9BURK|nr:Twin-arginine translocation pathway signal [Noviherbaspirillum denitrificans]